MRLFQPLISALIAVSTLTPLFAQDPPRPAYQFMRYDEDWSVLSDRSRRSDWLDPLKFISFAAPGWYVNCRRQIVWRPLFDNEYCGGLPHSCRTSCWLKRAFLSCGNSIQRLEFKKRRLLNVTVVERQKTIDRSCYRNNPNTTALQSSTSRLLPLKARRSRP